MARVMTETLSRDTLVHAGWWRALWGTLLGPWIRIKRDPAEPVTLLAPDTPVIYVIERDGFSDSLILERACHEAGLPSPLAWVPGMGKRKAELIRAAGVPTVREFVQRNPGRLAKAMAEANTKRKLVSVLPSEKSVGQLIERARKLPFKISY